MTLSGIFHNRYIRLIVVGISLILILTISQSILGLSQKRNLLHDRQKRLEDVVAQNERLKKELAEAQTPEFVEEEARRKLGMVKEGEAIVLLPKDSSTTESKSQGEQIVKWKQWWRLFW